MLDKTEIKPTPEQLACMDFIAQEDGNLMVNALAGTGKTTTLDLIQAASPVQPVLCLAFNKSVADEAAKRFPETTTVRTFNGLGHRIWANSVGKVTLDEKKSPKIPSILRTERGRLKGENKKESWDAYHEIISGVATAKALGYVPEGPNCRRLIDRKEFHQRLDSIPSPFIAHLIDTVLLKSIKAAYEGWIDYNDQIYMPALFGGSFPRFPLVLVDEAQDLNPTNHEMLKRLVKGRICGVGDPWQSIYGFRGAVQRGMDKIKSQFGMEERTISYSFRCPQAIVENARWRVPGFNWIKEGGHVEILQSMSANHIPESATIICRNNAPLFRLAFGLLSNKRSVQVAGSDVGPRLIGIMRKLGPPETTKSALLGKVAEWKDEKLASSNAPTTICDMADCMKVFAGFGTDLGQAVIYAEHLFKQQGTIKLITGHKAKGGEWPVVYHLDPWLIGEDEQELNLRYVIQTRSADRYYEINSKEIRW